LKKNKILEVMSGSKIATTKDCLELFVLKEQPRKLTKGLIEKLCEKVIYVDINQIQSNKIENGIIMNEVLISFFSLDSKGIIKSVADLGGGEGRLKPPQLFFKGGNAPP
jgi:hypothetical protein